MLDIQNTLFVGRHFATPVYYAHHTPPHTAYAYNNWTDLLQLPSPPDDVFQMQHLRFPTPPTTPPKGATHYELDTPQQQRTQSVIMKVGQVEQTQYTPAEVNAPLSKSATNTSSESSPPSSDYVCDWIDCGRYFESLESLATHVTQMHAIASISDSLYYCRWVGCQRSDRGFNARYKMLVHVRTHTKEKPHQCHLCEKCFSRAENLKIHIRSHSGEKPYVCTYAGCHKAYSNSSDRFKHTRTHSMEKPYMCKVPGCQKRYTDPSSLRKHVKTFKHNLQVMDSTPVNNAPMLQRCLTKNEPRNSVYLCVPRAQAPQFYMDEVCHFNAEKLKCYYATDAASANNFWIADVPTLPPSKATTTNYQNKNNNSYTLLNNETAMDIDLETPLDLRVKRS